MAVETLSNLGAELNISLMQGKYWGTILTIRDANGVALDITGYSFRGHVRQAPAGDLIAAFVFTPVDAPNGAVRVELPSVDTAGLLIARYVYDWEYADLAGEEHALVRGWISVVAEVTHA